jgi:4-amino-4-deoxy-L-arabinose transferase-like glycosyltransferase
MINVPLQLRLILVQGLSWVLLPLIFESSIRLDVAEGVIGGPEWQLSYFRHPPLSTWLTGLASMTGPWRYAAVYLIGQSLSLAALALVFVFVRRLDGRPAALLALMMGLASPFTTYVPIQVSHNIGLMPFWMLALLTAWLAFERGDAIAWALFGLSVGLGLWAKYAILLLVGPLAIAFLAVPQWRRQLLTPGPWIALCVGAIVIAPHVKDVLDKGATTIAFAIKAQWLGVGHNLENAAEFLLNCLLVQAIMVVIALAAVDRRSLVQAIKASVGSAASDRRELFVQTAAFGPIAVVLVAVMFGVRPRFLWISPFVFTFAIWWAHMARLAGPLDRRRRVWSVYGVFALLFVVAYIGVRLLAPLLAAAPAYADMDGPALARLAEHVWAQTQSGPIPYIVSLNEQRGRQAAGSIVFDLPYRVRVMENGSLSDSPWIDVADLKRKGALVVAARAVTPGTRVQGVEVTDLVVLPRPMKRWTKKAALITFGIIRPGS